MERKRLFNPVEVELQEEKAATYFRILRKLQEALDSLRRFDRSPSVHGAGQRRLKLLEEARECAWFFTIQREALKMPVNERIYREYDIPEEVLQGMGPKER